MAIGALKGSLGRAVARVVQRRQIDAITTAGEEGRRVTITYNKKTTGDTVSREIRPYEIKPHRTSGALMLYATDRQHGAGNIHSFLVGRILKVSEPDGKFKPVWPVKL